MRILIYGLNFAPELTGIGRFTGEMATWLAGQGHAVHVITAPPYYPAWHIADGYRFPLWRRESWGKVGVLRCPLYVPRKATGVRRVLHLGSFASTSTIPVLWQSLFWRPDILIAIKPTAAVVPAAWLAARLSGAFAWLHVQDFELDAAVNLGLLPPAIKRPAESIERAILGRFDTVSTISERMVERLSEKGVRKDRTVLFPNWVDTDTITPEADHEAFRRRIGIKPDDFVALYSGNIGKKQAIATIVSTARAVQRARRPDDPKIRFIIAGAGAGRADLEHELSSANLGDTPVTLLPLQPEDQLAGMLAGADIHLLPQRAEAADLVMPSKLGGMLASGRPVVAAAAPDTQIARVVTGRGLVVPPDDAAAMAGAVLTLARDAKLRVVLGAAARAAAVTEWDRATVLSRFESELEARVTAKRGDGR